MIAKSDLVDRYDPELSKRSANSLGVGDRGNKKWRAHRMLRAPADRRYPPRDDPHRALRDIWRMSASELGRRIATEENDIRTAECRRMFAKPPGRNQARRERRLLVDQYDTEIACEAMMLEAIVEKDDRSRKVVFDRCEERRPICCNTDGAGPDFRSKHGRLVAEHSGIGFRLSGTPDARRGILATITTRKHHYRSPLLKRTEQCANDL